MDIKQKTLEYFDGNELAAEVFLKKYSMNKEETPDDMHKRISKEIAKVEVEFARKYAGDYDKLSPYGQHRADIIEHNDPEYIRDYIFNLLRDFEYIIPGGSIQEGVGNPNYNGSLLNCFNNGSAKDSIDSIGTKVIEIMDTAKVRGGTSTSLDKLRPKGALINNASKKSTGIIPWLDFYNCASSKIGQNGRISGTMITLDCNHPDLLDFIKCKRDKTKYTNTNISVKWNKEFIKAAQKDEDYILTYPCGDISALGIALDEINQNPKLPYDVLLPIQTYTSPTEFTIKKYFKRIKAKEYWQEFLKSNWECGDPGGLFWDNILGYDPSSVYPEAKPTSTNLCGELPLPDYGACLLINTNLYSFINNPFTSKAEFNKELAYRTFYECTCLADDVIELELAQIDKLLAKSEIEGEHINNILCQNIKNVLLIGRKISCGFLGLGDFYAALGLKYGDKAMTEELMNLKIVAELDAQVDMAILRGTFPLWDSNKEYSGFFHTVPENLFYEFLLEAFLSNTDRMIKYGRRNVSWSSLPPTGSGSILAQTTSGIEPLFSPYYVRKVKVFQENEKVDFTDIDGNKFKNHVVVHPKLKEYFNINKDIFIDIPEERMNESDWDFVYRQSPYYEQCADDLDINTRTETQGLIQQYICSNISSTVNLPKDCTIEDINKVYLSALQNNCKSITCYRDGSKGGVLTKSASSNEPVFNYHSAPKRPKVLPSELHLITNKGVNYVVIVGLMDNKPYEVFVVEIDSKEGWKPETGFTTKNGKGNYSFKGNNVSIDKLSEGNRETEKAVALYTSMLLRHGADIKYVIKTAKKIDDTISSFTSAMCRVLGKYVVKEVLTEVCPECGSRLIKENGCTHCSSEKGACSYSKCMFIKIIK